MRGNAPSGSQMIDADHVQSALPRKVAYVAVEQDNRDLRLSKNLYDRHVRFLHAVIYERTEKDAVHSLLYEPPRNGFHDLSAFRRRSACLLTEKHRTAGLLGNDGDLVRQTMEKRRERDQGRYG